MKNLIEDIEIIKKKISLLRSLVDSSSIEQLLAGKVDTNGANVLTDEFKTALGLNNVSNYKIVTGDTYVSQTNQDIDTGLSSVEGFVAILHEAVGVSTNMGITLYWRSTSGGTVNVTPRNTGNGAYYINHTFNWWAIGT